MKEAGIIRDDWVDVGDIPDPDAPVEEGGPVFLSMNKTPDFLSMPLDFQGELTSLDY